MRCWGHPSEGALGFYFKDEDGLWAEIGDEEEDVPPPEVDLGGLPAVSIAAGDSHSCAALAGGTVTWGAGEYGRLGYGNQANIGDEPGEMPPADVDLGGAAVQISAGGLHTCALMASGAVRCWGAAIWGQIGYGSDEDLRCDVPWPSCPSAAKPTHLTPPSSIRKQV